MGQIQKHLEKNVAVMSSAEWKHKAVEIGMVKDEFTKIMCKFDNPEVLKHLKVLIKNRKKKRLNDRKRRDRKILVKEEETANRIKLHKEIDDWLNSKKEEVSC